MSEGGEVREPGAVVLDGRRAGVEGGPASRWGSPGLGSEPGEEGAGGP